MSSNERFPRAKGGAAGGGWRIDLAYLQKIREDMQKQPEVWDASEEAIEDVLLAVERLGVETSDLRRYVCEQLGFLTDDDNRPAEALIRMAAERLQLKANTCLCKVIAKTKDGYQTLADNPLCPVHYIQPSEKTPPPLTGVAFLHTWMRADNPMLGGITPLEMLKMGRGEKLAYFIEEAYEAEGGAERLAPTPKPYWEREPPHCSSCACQPLPEQVLRPAQDSLAQPHAYPFVPNVTTADTSTPDIEITTSSPRPTTPCCSYIEEDGRKWHEQHCPNGYK